MNKLSDDGMSNAVTLMVVIVLILTWIENMWSMFERLYDARPLPLVIQQVN